MVQIAGGIREIQIYCWWQPGTLAGKRTDRRLDRAARPESVAVVPLGTAEGQPIGMIAEHLLYGGGLGRVVERCGRSVCVDIAHLVGRYACLCQCVSHRTCGLPAVGTWGRHMVSIIRQP